MGSNESAVGGIETIVLAANVLLIVLAVYAAIGVAFALAFVTVGVARVDAAARGAPLGFRILIFPGSVALWPMLLWKWIES